MKGRVIVLEGLDGAGTTTQSKKLLRYLKSKNIPVKRIDCPGRPDSPISKLIHDYLYKRLDFSPEALFMLYSALHIQNTKKIKTWLAQGKTVVVDRYFPSTLAFQGAQGVKIEVMREFVQHFSIRPDVIIYLKIDPETGLKRKQKQGKKIDRHEENLVFLKKVSDLYDRLASEGFLGTWFIIDGKQPIEQVFFEVKNIIDKLFSKAVF